MIQIMPFKTVTLVEDRCWFKLLPAVESLGIFLSHGVETVSNRGILQQREAATF